MNNIEKLITLFEKIKSSIKNVEITINKEIDYDKINNFVNNYDSNISSLLDLKSFISDLNLSESEEKELDGILKIIEAFNSTNALSISSEMEMDIRNKNVILNVLNKLKELLNDYKNYKEQVERFNNEILKIDNIINGLKNKSSLTYIENLEEIYNYLYNKNDIDLKIKFEIYRLIGEYNIIVGKNKLDMLTNTNNNDKSSVDIKEETLNPILEDTSHIEELKNLFNKYNYDINKINKELLNKLINTNISNIEEVLKFFESINLRFNESLKSSEKYLLMLCRSDIDSLNKVKEICDENGIDIKVFLKKCPTATMKKNKDVTNKTSNKENTNKTVENNQQPSFSGAFEDFINNIETLKELGYNISKAMSECISIFTYPNESLKENIKALELYGISVKESNGTFKLSGLKNKDVLFTIDQFIELEELPYVTYNTSRFALSSDDAIFYRLYKIKKHNKENPLNQIEYKRYKEKGYDFLSIITQDKEGNSIVDRFSNKEEATGTIKPKVFDEETTTRLKNLIDNKRTYFNKNTSNIEIIKYLDLRYKSPNNDSVYIVSGKVFSRIKVMRLLSILENEKLDKYDLMVFCLTYNSIISSEEYEKVCSTIYGLERGMHNE